MLMIKACCMLIQKTKALRSQWRRLMRELWYYTNVILYLNYGFIRVHVDQTVVRRNSIIAVGHERCKQISQISLSLYLPASDEEVLQYI